MMFFKTAILIFVTQLDAVKTYGPVRSIDDLVREVSTAVSESLIAMSNDPWSSGSLRTIQIELTDTGRSLIEKNES